MYWSYFSTWLWRHKFWSPSYISRQAVFSTSPKYQDKIFISWEQKELLRGNKKNIFQKQIKQIFWRVRVQLWLFCFLPKLMLDTDKQPVICILKLNYFSQLLLSFQIFRVVGLYLGHSLLFVQETSRYFSTWNKLTPPHIILDNRAIKILFKFESWEYFHPLKLKFNISTWT